LALAARERVERLAERDVAETDVGEAVEDDPDRPLGEEAARLFNGHGQDLDDVPSTQAVAENLICIAAALTNLAHARDGGHEPEIGVDRAETVAGRTCALRVRPEQGRLDVVRLREGRP